MSLAVGIPGVVLERDLPIPTIEDKIEPQGHTEDAAACNANLEPLDVAGKHVRNLVWGNGTENTARRVLSRQL